MWQSVISDVYKRQVQNSMEGAAVHCLVHHVSGYTGTFLGFFSSYEECKEKSFRVVILSNKVPYEGQAIITNSPNAWGSDNGKVGCVALGAVKPVSYTHLSSIPANPDRSLCLWIPVRSF